MKEPTVAAGYARALLRFAVALGADEAVLLDRSGIEPAALANQDGRLKVQRYVQLMYAAKDLCREPALGLKFAEVSEFREFSIVGLICRASPTMGEAFIQMNRFARLVFDVDGIGRRDRFEIVRDRGSIWLVDHRPLANAFHEFTESSLARFVCEHRRAFANAPFAKSIHFTHPEPPYGNAYKCIFKAPVVFDSDRNAIEIYDSWLSIRISDANAYVFGILSKHAQELLESLENAQTLKGQLEGLLLPVLHQGAPDMAEIARTIGMSRQTLYRRLRDEGVTFEKVLDTLRHTMANHYLSDKKASVNEVAYLVGFSEPSAFSRAFKRWEGRAPKRLLENTLG